MYMYSSLVQISDESICGMDFHSALEKDWASNIAINTKPEAHPCFVGPHIGPWPNISKVLTPHRHHKLTVVWKALGIRWMHG